MTKAVLLVDEDDRRRREVAAELRARAVPVLEVTDAFDAMATLGRADLGALVLGEDRRRFSLRGLCHLARRRHPSVRLIVLAQAAVEARTVEASLGISVDVLDADAPPGGVAAHVLALMARPLDPFLEPPPTRETDLAIEQALAEVKRERGEPNAPVWDAPALSTTATRPAPSPRATLEPLLEGVLEEETGTALLMGIFSQELTGRLEVTGGAAAGTLYFYRGEPVAADHAQGNAGLLEELERHDLVPEGLDIQFVPDGELLATLVAAGNVTGEAMHRFVGGFVRGRLFELVMQRDGTYRFLEDHRFLDSAPLLRVNPFGVMLERRKSRTPPPELAAQHDELRDRLVRPRPALRLAAEKLRPFAAGQRLDELIGDGVVVEQLLRRARLDELMGTLLVLTLHDGRLIEIPASPASDGATLSDAAAPPPVALDEPPLVPGAPAMALPELEPMADTLTDDVGAAERDDDARVREEVLSLYMRLKPISHPRQVLGVPLWADKDAVEAAYRRRLDETDPRRLPEGPSRDMLASRLEELRAKVIRAMEALQFQQGQAPVSAAAAPSRDDDSNPF